MLSNKYLAMHEADAEQKLKDFADYFPKTSEPNDKNLARHFDGEKNKPLIALAKKLSKKYKIGLDGDSIVAPIDGGEVSVKVGSKDGKPFWVAYDNYKTQKGYGWDKDEKEVEAIFKKEGITK